MWLKSILRLAYRASEGGVVGKRGNISVSCFERGRGGDVVGIHPLRLAFRAREGVVMWLKIHRVLCFERGKGGGGWKTPVLRLQSLTFGVARLFSHRNCAQNRKYV
jgi:hypothetical protein